MQALAAMPDLGLAGIAPAIIYRREVLPMDDGGDVALDWVDDDSFSASVPTIIVLHGLSGSSEENYIRSFVNMARRNGWRSVVYNRRGHADHDLPVPANLFQDQHEHSKLLWKRAVAHLKELRTWPRHGDTADLFQVSEHCHHLYPDAPLLCVGFSAGSNLLCKYLGEAGDTTPVDAAVIISNGFDLVNGTKLLERDRPFVNRVVTFGLRRIYKRHKDVLLSLAPIDHERVMSAKSIRAFDREVPVKIYGYKDVDDYYAQNDSVNLVKHIQRPVVFLNAVDDIIIHPSVLPLKDIENNPNLVLCMTKHGGHMGWVEGWRMRSWMNKVCEQYITAFVDYAAEHSSRRHNQRHMHRHAFQHTFQDGARHAPAGSHHTAPYPHKVAYVAPGGSRAVPMASQGPSSASTCSASSSRAGGQHPAHAANQTGHHEANRYPSDPPRGSGMPLYSHVTSHSHADAMSGVSVGGCNGLEELSSPRVRMLTKWQAASDDPGAFPFILPGQPPPVVEYHKPSHIFAGERHADGHGHSMMNGEMGPGGHLGRDSDGSGVQRRSARLQAKAAGKMVQ
eukprot:jgi/Mesvir1/2295/Mv19331-RA.1